MSEDDVSGNVSVLISQLLSDPVLSDIPDDITLEEVDRLIGLEQGQAMSLRIQKLDGSEMGKH